jgi:hypothetical protein
VMVLILSDRVGASKESRSYVIVDGSSINARCGLFEIGFDLTKLSVITFLFLEEREVSILFVIVVFDGLETRF